MTEQVLVKITQYENSISAKCRVSDPLLTIKLIQILSEMRDELLQEIEGFLNDLMESHDVPKDIKTLFEKRKIDSSLIELIKKIRTIDNPEETEQLMKDIEGVIKGR